MNCLFITAEGWKVSKEEGRELEKLRFGLGAGASVQRQMGQLRALAAPRYLDAIWSALQEHEELVFYNHAGRPLDPGDKSIF